MKNFYEKTVESNKIFEGRVVKLRVDRVILPNGKEATREVVEHPGAVAVVALTDKDEIVMVRQFRKPVEETTLEIPAGKLEGGEDPHSCARRELEEETGLKPNRIKLLMEFYTTPGFSDEKMYLFLAEDLEEVPPHRDDDELVEVEKLPLGKAVNWVMQGKINDAKTIIGILAVDCLRSRKGGRGGGAG
ncbi:NUDIX hydrolase [Calderihabitans maritimus]|uniref:NUDIX hydrolase n=1 Tax=Calderihabitans maritimus TaxID=1246530 RepID=A0A1Z5HQ59_9FIRM|nr:NUDIX hydrolase [Calderihabitans maritimus]GAW91676.1 NUDIX hydrolase [Calderihabitans maritimus]